MATEIFLQLDGIKGESQQNGFVGAIEIFSVSYGISNTPTATGQPGKANLSSISVQTQLSSASAALFQACASGAHIKSGTLSVREASGAGPTAAPYLVISMTGVVVDSISDGAAAGGGKPSESISLSYATIKYLYTAAATTGAPAASTPFTWNVIQNHP